MRRLGQYILLMGGLATVASATSVLTCSTTGGPFTSSGGCGSSTPSFSNIETGDLVGSNARSRTADSDQGTSREGIEAKFDHGISGLTFENGTPTSGDLDITMSEYS